MSTVEDRPAIWAVFGPIVAAGETYTEPRDASSDAARELWTDPMARVSVAEEADRIVGSARLRPDFLRSSPPFSRRTTTPTAGVGLHIMYRRL